MNGGSINILKDYPQLESGQTRQIQQHFIASNGTIRVQKFLLGNTSNAGFKKAEDCLIRVGGENGRFTAAPLQGAQTLTIKNDVFLDIDARALVQPDGGTVGTYPLASDGGRRMSSALTARMPGDVKFFMIRRVYDFINQTE